VRASFNIGSVPPNPSFHQSASSENDPEALLLDPCDLAFTPKVIDRNIQYKMSRNSERTLHFK